MNQIFNAVFNTNVAGTWITTDTSKTYKSELDLPR